MIKPNQWTKFLQSYAKYGTISAAAKVAKINRDSVYEHIKESPEFAEKMQRALDEWVDSLVQIAEARAKKKSDALLMFLLRSHRAEIYGNKVEATVKGTGPGGAIRLTLEQRLQAEREVDDELRRFRNGDFTINVAPAPVSP